MADSTQEMWTAHFTKMAKGHQGYHDQFYMVKTKMNDEQKGGGRGNIQVVQPTQQQVAQAKMQIKHDLEDDDESSKKKKKRRKLNDFQL